METDRIVGRTISSMQPGEHACCVYAGDEPFRDVFARYVSGGLEADQKIIYLYHAHAPETLAAFLREAGVDARAALQSGQLILRPGLEVFGPPERFDTRPALAAVRAIADEARYAGFPALRAAVDLAWAASFLPGSPGASRLAEYETALGQPGAVSSHLFLCMLDQNIFHPALLEEILSVHRLTCDGNKLIANTRYIPPEVYQARRREQRAAEHRPMEQRPMEHRPAQQPSLTPTGQLPGAYSSGHPSANPSWGKRGGQKTETLASVQAALQESVSRYKAIFDNATDSIFIHDLDGHILDVNSAACQRLSYTAGELLGKTPDFLDAPELAGQYPLRLNLLQRYGTLSFETVFISRLGEMVPVEINSRLIDYSGRPAVISIARDITDRKRAEVAQLNANQALANANEALAAANQALEAANAALKESEQKFRLLIENSPNGVLLVDESGRMIEFNPANEQIYGVPVTQVLGKLVVDFLHETQPPELRREYRYTGLLRGIQDALVTGKADWLGHVMEREISCPDGQRRFIQAIGFPIQTERGWMIGVITRDVTDHRRAELELEQYRQRLEMMVAERTAQLLHEIHERQQAEENLEVMLREIHHRVKNNLNVIIALIDLQKSGQTDAQVLQVFKELQTRAYTMALVHESLYRSPNLAQVDFSGYLHTLVAYLDTAYGPAGRGVRVHLNVEAENVPLKIEMAIPCGLIVNELVTNALKYAFPPESDLREGEISVRLTAEGQGDTRRYMLAVRDNGIGLAPDRSWQAGETLGLQLVQVLTRQLGGRIDLETAPLGADNHGAAWRLEFAERRA